MGCGRRNEVKRLLKSGRVTREAQIQVAPDRDQVTLDGALVLYRQYLYLMLHKPAGVISATEDRRERTALIKRMFQALGKKALYLRRFFMGPLVLDEWLGPGEYRELTGAEIATLEAELS
jgi:16S rRNA U516 pseudouridylate synthase RsuA-like enzyme